MKLFRRSRWTSFFVITLFSLLIVFVFCYSAPLPEKQNVTERLGALPLKHAPVQTPVKIHWNEHQIPFIVAQSDDDAAFGLGVVSAHLRLGQIELLRHLSQGRLAELFGPSLVEVDHALRIIDFGKQTSAIRDSLPPETRQWLRHFVNGLNFYQEKTTQLPHEFHLLGITPQRWKIEDIITIGRLVATDVNWLIWFQLLSLTAETDSTALWTRMLESGARSVPSFGANSQAWSLLAERSRSGSNAFAVSGRRSGSGNAILATDPHVGFQFPNLWMAVGIKSPSYHVIGLTIPGLPFVALGRNKDIAWGGTNMWALSSSLYRATEKELAEAVIRQEKIKVRWWRDRLIKIRETSLGPIVTDAPQLHEQVGKEPSALRWMGHQTSDEFTPFLRVGKATSWQEFRNAFESYGVSGQNMVFADRHGGIGQLLAVRFAPAASRIEKSFILNSSDAASHWSKIYRSTELPSVYDPPNGVIASTNNVPVQFQPALGRSYPSNDRQVRIMNLLHDKKIVSLQDMMSIQLDVRVPSSVALRDSLLLLLKDKDSLSKKEQEFFNRVVNWDGEFKLDSGGASAFTTLLHNFARRYYKRFYNERIADFLMRSPYLHEFLLEDLVNRAQDGAEEMLLESVRESAKNKDSWKDWGSIHRILVQHVFGNIPIVGSRYRFGEIGAPGSTNSVLKSAHGFVDQTHYSSYGAVARFCTDLADLNENYVVLLGGQDGFLNSSTFLDQVTLWQQGHYVKLPLEMKQVKKDFPFVTILAP